MSDGGAAFTPSLLPVLVYRDGIAALAWLSRVFGLRELRRVTDDAGALLHAEVRWEHGAAMVTSLAAAPDGSLERMVGASWVWAVVADPDEHHRRAADLEGHRWTFSSHRPVP